MNDREMKTVKPNETVALPPADASHAANSGKPHEREKLPAEKKFDKAVYGGISYAAQAGTGIALSYWIKHGSGRPIYDKIAKWFGPNVISKITSKTGQEAIKEADSWIIVTTMVSVGNLFLLPVKWLENRKPEIVRNWTEKQNEKLEKAGHPVSEATKKHQEELLQELEAEPKQNWKSLISGRVFALGAVYAVLHATGKDANEKMANLTAEATSKGVNGLGFTKVGQSKPFQNIINTAFYDVFYSAVSAGGLYVYSHFIQPPKAKHPDEEHLDHIPAVNEQPTTREPRDASPSWQVALQKKTENHAEQFDKHTDYQESVIASKADSMEVAQSL